MGKSLCSYSGIACLITWKPSQNIRPVFFSCCHTNLMRTSHSWVVLSYSMVYIHVQVRKLLIIGQTLLFWCANYKTVGHESYVTNCCIFKIHTCMRLHVTIPYSGFNLWENFREFRGSAAVHEKFICEHCIAYKVWLIQK